MRAVEEGNPETMLGARALRAVLSVALAAGASQSFTQVAFRSEPPILVSDDPHQLAAADFDGDGKIDLIVGHGIDFRVNILHGLGDGRFIRSIDVSTGAAPISVATADFDGDGHADFVSANLYGSSVTVGLGSGNGKFPSLTTFATEAFPEEVQVADFDGDGHADIVVASENQVTLLINDGSGGFAAIPGPATRGFTRGSSSVAAADLTGDGAIDLVTSNYRPRDTISVLIGHGDGTFDPPVDYAAPGAVKVVVGDVDGDGVPDVVVADDIHSTVSILRNLGDGSLETTAVYDVPCCPEWIMLADINHNGTLDIAAFNAGGIAFLFGAGDGSFRAPVSVANTGNAHRGIAIDLNGDGRSDLAFSSLGSEVNVLINTAETGISGPRVQVEAIPGLPPYR